MLEAAVAEFSAKGWRNARLGDIVARSGGSMATLYRAFGNKQGLAHALISREADLLVAGLLPLGNDATPPARALAEAADGVIDVLLKPETLLINRIAIADGRDVPEIRDMFFAQTVAPAQDILCRYLQRQHAAGRLHAPHPAHAARMFFMGLVGETLIRCISGIDETPDPDRTRQAAHAALAIMLDGFRLRER
ncbi:TetR family transcriptional regulator [Lysobacter ruishenii]|uniref:TetR family transcriptional regulator n=2 Tax=Aerolutibacter ruishenii TaxID=686800 RepID=A0A562LHZ9_9GAMM|nr:TetR family transcriptional regulator [Lysobacter ruishenii]